jgi:hypothetical protein
METNTENNIVDTEAIEIKTLSLVDATLQTAKASFAELVKESSVDKKAKELKAQLKKADINGIEDNQGYALVKRISKDASKIRIAIEKRRKELKSDIITAGKNIDALANEYQALINPIENDADAKLKIVDDAIEQEKLRVEREAKEKLDNRVKTLIESGIVFTGSWYGINEIQVGIQMIQEMSDDDYNDLLQKVRVQNDLNIAEIKRKDEEAKEFQRIQEQLRIENEEKERQLKEKEDALNAKLKEMADKEAEVERKIKAQQEEEARQAREEEAKKKEQEAQAIRQLLKEKATPFETILGMTYSFNNETWSRTIDNKTWSVTKEEILADVADIELIKKEMDEATLEVTKRELELEKQREEARIAKAQQEEEARKSLLNDTDLFNEYKSSLKEIQAPIVKDASIKAQIDAIANLIN